MVGGYSISLNERFFRWLADQIRHLERGSIHLEVEDGQLRSIGCHGHRFFHSADDLKEPTP